MLHRGFVVDVSIFRKQMLFLLLFTTCICGTVFLASFVFNGIFSLPAAVGFDDLRRLRGVFRFIGLPDVLISFFHISALNVQSGVVQNHAAAIEAATVHNFNPFVVVIFLRYKNL